MPGAGTPITWVDERPDPAWCASAGATDLGHQYSVPGVIEPVRLLSTGQITGSCYGVTIGGTHGLTVRAPADNWPVLVIEGCRVLTVTNGLAPTSDAGRAVQRSRCYQIGAQAAQGACPH